MLDVQKIISSNSEQIQNVIRSNSVSETTSLFRIYQTRFRTKSEEFQNKFMAYSEKNQNNVL